MPFPSTLSSFNRPSATDRLNSPSHSALHNTVSSAVGQIEQVIGLSTTSVVGSLFYDIRSPDSNGGGHVQTANKGGTGQTTFTKGDLLVATSASVLSKFAVSSTVNEVLVADPAQAAGMKWATNPNSNKVAIQRTSIASSSTAGTTQTLFAASILGSTLGTANGIRFEGVIQDLATDSSQVFTLAAKYGNNTIATVASPASGAIGSVMTGLVRGTIVANGGTSSQLGFIAMDAAINHSGEHGTTGGPTFHLLKQGSSSVESTANQELVITAQWANGSTGRGCILTGIFTVEKLS